MIDELIAIASIGTARKVPTLSAVETPPLAEALATIKDLPPEAMLLSAAALLSAYESAGRVPGAAVAAPEAADPDANPQCTNRAGDLLELILGMTVAPVKQHLMGEWLGYAVASGRRMPYRLLPALLDYGTSHRPSRRSIAVVAGARGEWLSRFDAGWQWSAAGPQEAGAIWTTGTRDERIAFIRSLRETDAGAARELIRSTWREDSAEDRAAFLAAMSSSLEPADEEFLELALDDRGKQVRMAAAELLVRLPNSMLVRRMIERAAPLLKVQIGKKPGLLRKGTPTVLEISLPPETFDPGWARDGIVEKPDSQMGRRQWWLMQFVAAIPPSHWSEAWGLSPAQCIEATKVELGDVLLSGWSKAADRHADSSWLAPLLLAAIRESRGPLALETLNLIPESGRSLFICALLESPGSDIGTALRLLKATQFQFDASASGALYQLVDRQMSSQPTGYVHAIAQLLQEAAVRLPPEAHDELLERWAGEKWDMNRKRLGEFFQTLQLRRDLKREFGQ